ncbi:unnamed protein product, partial [Medioppia subpectinata]
MLSICPPSAQIAAVLRSLLRIVCKSSCNVKNLDNLSLVIHGPNDLRLEQTPIKQHLEDNDVKNLDNLSLVIHGPNDLRLEQTPIKQHLEDNDVKNLDNLSLVIHGPNDLRLEQTPIKQHLEDNECLLETHSCGFCGTDIHLMDHGRMADFIVKEPLVIGHETSATVIAIGKNVTNLKVGDRVAVETAIPCQKCEYCREGKYNLCPISNTQARGLPPKHGCLRRYYAHPSDFLFKLPDNVSWEEGAMCEPFSCIVHACRRLNITAGQNVLVCGAGAMGMMAFLCAKAFGANKVFITDLNKSRLA